MPFIFGASGSTNQTLVLLGGDNVWLAVGVVSTAVLVFALAVFNYRHLVPARRRWSLLILRFVALVLLVGLFYQPALLEERHATSRNRLAVVLDISKSMVLKHGVERRADLAARFIQANQAYFTSLKKDNDLAIYTMGESLKPVGGELGPELVSQPSDSETKILQSLAEVRRANRNRDLGGVIVVTDGIDSTGLTALTRADEVALNALNAPVFPVVLPQSGDLRDVSLEHVAYNSFAFLLNRSSLDVTIKVHGFEVGTRPVVLKENGQQIARSEVTVVPGQTTYRVTFQFVPRKLGKRVFSVHAAAWPGEITLKNNSRQLIINVIRDKIRVLQIVGQPNWDERFLRNHLKQNPNVDLISFFILVNTQNYRPVSSRETALIPFPAKELFEDELGGFDLVVFQNFNYGPFRTRQYLPHIARFVRDGGAFMMVGGPLSFSGGGYSGTPITDVLPVNLPPGPPGSVFGVDEAARDATRDLKTFEPQLTSAGEHHPVSRLALDPAANRARWKNLGALDDLNKTEGLKPDALALVVHPTLKGRDGRPMPVVAVAEPGKGRSLAVMTGSTWNWLFKAGNAGKDHRHYDQFWSGAIRWLIKDPELDLVRVGVDRERVRVGDEAKIRVEVLSPDYKPADRQPVDVFVWQKNSDGTRREVKRLKGAQTTQEGLVTLQVKVGKAAVYEVEARSSVVKGRVTVGRNLFVGTERDSELNKIVPERSFMNAIATTTGGVVFPMTAVAPSMAFKPPRVVKVTHRSYRDLWTSLWVFFAIIGLIGTEWWFRRKYGYL